ncbi:MAG: histidine triad nucleotide-binding protein [Leptospiraceae bacterium]|nr:histidine triad nucleotide-binding protein [Leptospiraceae bacterium]MBK9498052.1 histidine triad nucleotide-binding protein [Leptospiraceae bacterium]MBP9164397.1 histidine triad nucleotide-binding protein [Leptospiraceae bacterium]
MSVCIFCKIVEKIIPAGIVHESDNCIGFKDLNPVAPNHLLFIPKKHIESVDKMTEEDSHLIGKIIFEMTEYAKANHFSNGGYRIVNNTGADAGQTVFHIHFHLLAGRKMEWPPG